MKRAAIFLLFCAFSAGAQLPMIAFSGGGGGTRSGGFQGNATFHLPLPPVRTQVSAPYSGQQSQQVVQTLADGTHVTRTAPPGQKAWRDSQGRVRMERTFLAGNNKLTGVPTLVEIVDPAAGYAYIMDDVTRVVHRVKITILPALPAQPTLPAPQGGPSTTQSLGQQIVDGVMATGTRTTTTIPPGPQNDGPITVTQDVWYSPDLHLIVQMVTTDPRSGVSTNEIANLSTIEPDPSLFAAPTDYAMVDETGSAFTITWGGQ